MNLAQADRDTLKALIKEVMLENPAFFKLLLQEIVAEQHAAERQQVRRQRLSAILDEEVEGFDEVFRKFG